MTPHDFQKTYATKLKERKEGKWPEYFLPEEAMIESSRAALADCMEELPSDDVADIVEGILGDISHGSLEGAQGIPLDLDSQLQAAQLRKHQSKDQGSRGEALKTETGDLEPAGQKSSSSASQKPSLK